MARVDSSVVTVTHNYRDAKAPLRALAVATAGGARASSTSSIILGRSQYQAAVQSPVFCRSLGAPAAPAAVDAGAVTTSNL